MASRTATSSAILSVTTLSVATLSVTWVMRTPLRLIPPNAGDPSPQDRVAPRPIQPLSRALHQPRLSRMAWLTDRRLRHLALLCQTIEVREHFLDMHDVRIFMMQVEQVDLVVDHGAIVGAFLDHRIVKTVRIGIDGARAHAARGALSADDQAVDPFHLQMCDERRAEKSRGAFLIDDEFDSLIICG